MNQPTVEEIREDLAKYGIELSEPDEEGYYTATSESVGESAELSEHMLRIFHGGVIRKPYRG